MGMFSWVPEGDVLSTRETQILIPKLVNFVHHVLQKHSPRNSVLTIDWSVLLTMLAYSLSFSLRDALTVYGNGHLLGPSIS